MRSWETPILILTLLVACAIMADNITTAIGFAVIGDTVHELNPISRFLIGYWGVNTTMVINAFVGIILAMWVMDVTTARRSWFGVVFLIIALVLRGWGAINNYHILITYS